MKTHTKRHIITKKPLTDIFSFRALFIIASFAYLIFPFVLKYNDNKSIDPLWGRIAVSSIIMLVFGLSFFSQHIRKHIVYYGYLLSFILTAYYEYLMYINNMSAGYAIGYFTIALCVVVLFRSITSLILYMVFSFSGILLLFYLLPAPVTNPMLFLSILITVHLVTFFVLISRIALINDLGLKNTQLNTTNIHLHDAVEKINFANVQLEQQKEEIETQRATLEQQNIELKKLSTIVSKTGNAIMIFDKNKNLEWVNDGFTKLFGYTKKEFIEINGRNLIKTSKNNNIENLVNKCIDKNKSVPYEAINYTKSGDKLWVQTTMTPIFDDIGILTNIVTIDSDISILKEAEEKIKKNANLKEIFLANTSHEIRTPLNAMIGFTNLLLNTKLSDNQADYLTNIKTSGDNLLFIVNDILDFSKIEAGKLSIIKNEFDLRKLVKQLINTHSVKTSEKNINLNYHINKEIPNILIGDSLRLSQILINLIGNSIKFTNNYGEIKLNIDIKNNNKDNIDINFAVSDTGIGIPKNQLKNIFNSFTQVDEQTTRKYGGTGLGLCIVKRLVELQDGEISVKSDVGKGTTFLFTLNFKKSKKLPEKIINSTKDIFKKTIHKHTKILLVEDNNINRKLVIDTIQMWGKNIKIDIAENGLTAIEKIKNNKYDLVLMDVQMPEMDGYETTKYIRKKLKNNLPIIAITAYTLNHEAKKCLTAGMNDYISKPFDPQILYNKICKYTNQKRELLNNNTKEQDLELSTSNNKLINLSLLNRIYHNDQKKINKILQMYLDSIPNEILTLKNHFEQKNWEQIKRDAHTLKPKMSYLGLTSLYETAKKIEINIDEIKNSKELLKMINDISNTWGKAEYTIQEILKLHQ